LTEYEILLLLDPDLEEDRQNEIVSRIRETAERGGGTWERQDAWGRRKLAYEIRHKGEGTYHLLLFRCEPETLDEISRVLRITDGVLRHMAVRRPRATSTQTPTTAPAPAAEATAPAPAATAPAPAPTASAPEREAVQDGE